MPNVKRKRGRALLRTNEADRFPTGNGVSKLEPHVRVVSCDFGKTDVGARYPFLDFFDGNGDPWITVDPVGLQFCGFDRRPKHVIKPLVEFVTVEWLHDKA